MNIIKRTGLIFLYALIVLLTISGAMADEIPSVQLEDTTGISYLNIFNYNTSIHNNLTELQGGLAPNQYYHFSYADYIAVQTALGNITFDLSDFTLNEGYIYVGNSSNNPEGKSSSDFITGFNIGNYTEDEIFNVVDNKTFYLLSNPYNFYNNSDFDINDYATNIKVDSIGNWSLDKFYYWNTSTKLNVSVNITTSGWFNGRYNISTADDWNSFDGSLIDFNESKLEIVYYNLNESNIIAGTLDGGTLIDTQHPDGIYDGVTVNFTEVAGSPALDIRLNFTNIDDFSRGIIRYKTSSLSGDYPLIQMWNYNHSDWEDYPPIAETLIFATITQPVFDSSSHLKDGIAQMRIYKLSNGNINNHYYIDWIAISKGYGVPSGEEIDPYSWHLIDFNITDYSTTTQANLLYAPIGYGDQWNETYADTLYSPIQWNETYADTLYSPINYNPFNQSLNTSDSVQFNNVTINNIVFDENRTITINDTCMIFKAFDTYIDLCK